jgi:hypothetical protein
VSRILTPQEQITEYVDLGLSAIKDLPGVLMKQLETQFMSVPYLSLVWGTWEIIEGK